MNEFIGNIKSKEDASLSKSLSKDSKHNEERPSKEIKVSFGDLGESPPVKISQSSNRIEPSLDAKSVPRPPVVVQEVERRVIDESQYLGPLPTLIERSESNVGNSRRSSINKNEKDVSLQLEEAPPQEEEEHQTPTEHKPPKRDNDLYKLVGETEDYPSFSSKEDLYGGEGKNLRTESASPLHDDELEAFEEDRKASVHRNPTSLKTKKLVTGKLQDETGTFRKDQLKKRDLKTISSKHSKNARNHETNVIEVKLPNSRQKQQQPQEQQQGMTFIDLHVRNNSSSKRPSKLRQGIQAPASSTLQHAPAGQQTPTGSKRTKQQTMVGLTLRLFKEEDDDDDDAR